MAIANVKYLEGPDKGKQAKVSTSMFKNRINGTAFDRTKKYSVKLDDENYCKVQVIFIEDSETELDNKIKTTRERLHPSSKLETETEDDESAQKIRRTQSVAVLSKTAHGSATTSTKDKQKIQQQKMKKFASVLNMKTDTFQSLINEETNNTKNLKILMMRKSKVLMITVENELEEAKGKAKNFQTLNMELETKVIEMFEDQTTIKKQIEETKDQHSIDSGKNFVPVGRFFKSENNYHIGRGISLPAVMYDGVMEAKSPSSMVGNAIVAVFSIPVLLKSTKTGNISNKTIGQKMEKTGDPKPKVEKLNETSLAACREASGEKKDKDKTEELIEEPDERSEDSVLNNDKPKKKNSKDDKPENKNLKDDKPESKKIPNDTKNLEDEPKQNYFKTDKSEKENFEHYERTNNLKDDQNEIQFISTETIDNSDLSDVTSEVESIADYDDDDDPLQVDGKGAGENVPDVPTDDCLL